MKLELKHLAPYLPYGLKAIYYFENEENEIVEITGTSLFSNELHYQLRFKDGKTIGLFKDDFKPILRPLSDLTKEIDHNGESFVPFEKIKNYHTDYFCDTDFENYILDRVKNPDFWACVIFLPSGLVDLLLKWHFDVFGLIPKGLAINKNILKTESI